MEKINNSFSQSLWTDSRWPKCAFTSVTLRFPQFQNRNDIALNKQAFKLCLVDPMSISVIAASHEKSATQQVQKLSVCVHCNVTFSFQLTNNFMTSVAIKTYRYCSLRVFMNVPVLISVNKFFFRSLKHKKRI